MLSRKVKHLSSSLEPYFLFHSLVNIVDSDDFTLGKSTTQNLSVEINTLCNNVNQNTTVKENYSGSTQTHVVNPNIKSEPQF